MASVSDETSLSKNRSIDSRPRRGKRRGHRFSIDERMSIPKWEDKALPVRLFHRQLEDDRESTTIVDFVLLRSPLASARDPETAIVRRKHRIIDGCPQLSHSCTRGTQC